VAVPVEMYDRLLGGLMESIDASLQRGRQGLCPTADEPASPPERGGDCREAGNPCVQPLQVEESLAVAGGGEAC
jgi:hypothetical protein